LIRGDTEGLKGDRGDYQVKKILIALVAIPVLFWVVWFVLPETSIRSIIENSICNKKFRLEVKGLKKGLFYNLSIDDLILKRHEEELIILNNIKSRINPIYLFIFQLRCSYHGEIGGGKFSGHMNLAQEKARAELDFIQANISSIQLFKNFGIQGTGTVSGGIIIGDNIGYIDFSTNDAKFEPLSFSDFRVPMNFFQTVKGYIKIKEEMINIISLTLEGRNIYARLKGIVKNNMLDAKMELMPGKSFNENPLFIYEFERYKVSPGYYVMPLKMKL
jgi:type II secretion system protein N